jgi:hypothetical protein
MGFFSNYTDKNPTTNTKTTVNVEWVLRKLDEIGTTSRTSMGFAPALPNETTTTKYLRQDGSWVVPPDTNTNTTYTASTGLSLSGTAFSINTASSITITGTWNVPTPALPS